MAEKQHDLGKGVGESTTGKEESDKSILTQVADIIQDSVVTEDDLELAIHYSGGLLFNVSVVLELLSAKKGRANRTDLENLYLEDFGVLDLTETGERRLQFKLMSVASLPKDRVWTFPPGESGTLKFPSPEYHLQTLRGIGALNARGNVAEFQKFGESPLRIAPNGRTVYDAPFYEGEKGQDNFEAGNLPTRFEGILVFTRRVNDLREISVVMPQATFVAASQV